MNTVDKLAIAGVIWLFLMLILAVGYDASWLHGCGTTKCFVGFSYNPEFKLW